MKKVLILTNAQALTLYNILANAKLDRIPNRARWKFLEVIEDEVFSYEKLVQTAQKKVNEEKDPVKKNELVERENVNLKTLSEEKKEFTFNDREIYAEVKTLFELSGKELEGQQGRIYAALETAFMDVKEIE